MMTPFEKALAWHKLGKAWSPNAASVQHVDAILAELERIKAAQPVVNVSIYPPERAPDPALVDRLRYDLAFGRQRRALAVAIDIGDVEQLLNVLDPQPSAGDAKR